MRRALLCLVLTGPALGCEIGPIVDIGRSTYDGGRPAIRDGGSLLRRDGGITRRDSGVLNPRRADLVVEEIGPLPAAVVPEDVLAVALRIHNRGEFTSQETLAQIRLVPVDGPNGVEIGLVTVPPLIPDERLERTRILPVPRVLAAGTYRVVVEVDPDDRVLESDETNNRRASESITVSDLALVPTTLDFGVVGTGCTKTIAARIENRGPTRRFLSRAELDPLSAAVFSLEVAETPLGIDAGDVLEMSFTFEPTDVGSFEGTFLFEQSQLVATTAIPVRGQSAVNPRREEERKQLTAPRIDILFVIDNSFSMQQEREELGRGAAEFFQYVEARGVDYRVAITTTDVSATGERGVFVGSPAIITRSMPNAAQLFEANVQVGTTGASAEQGLEAAKLALSEPATLGPNAGFLRPEASLAIVFVSDEDDSSPDTIDEYDSFFERLKDPEGDARFVANAIVGPPEGCNTAVAGTRYAELSRRTAGVTESICAFNWSSALRNFPGAGFGYQHAFPLVRVPTAGSLEVIVNGTVLPRVDAGSQRANWYLLPGPMLVFDAIAVPEPAAIIVVRYESEC